MNLYLKAATTFAAIVALSAFPGTHCSFASGTEWDDSNSDPSLVSSSPAPVAPIAAASQTSPASVSPNSVAAIPAAVVVGPALIEPKAGPVSINLLPPAPPASGYFSLNAKAPAPGTIAGSPALSPFIHSEPRGSAPFPLLLNRSVQNYVEDFLDRPEGLKLAFERSRPFMPQMIKLMKEQGIPDDLVYLSFAESAFSKQGKGPWQFTSETAARFGLRVDKWLDERRDPILSTKAAAEYLAELHDQADNDWRVALIAWNMGEANLDRYWLLEGANYTKFADRLPRRTRQLLNRFMAVAFIARNSAAYGIGDVQYSAAPVWTMRNFKGGTLLSSIAEKFETTVSKLRDLNPALRADRIPPNERTYSIRIPTDEEASY